MMGEMFGLSEALIIWKKTMQTQCEKGTAVTEYVRVDGPVGSTESVKKGFT